MADRNVNMIYHENGTDYNIKVITSGSNIEGVVPVDKGGTDADNPTSARENLDAQRKIAALPAVVDTTNWIAQDDAAFSDWPFKKTITVNGIPPDTTTVGVEAWPVVASKKVWEEAGMWPYSHALNTITFYAEAIPTDNVSIYIQITEVVNSL